MEMEHINKHKHEDNKTVFQTAFIVAGLWRIFLLYNNACGKGNIPILDYIVVVGKTKQSKGYFKMINIRILKKNGFKPKIRYLYS